MRLCFIKHLSTEWINNKVQSKCSAVYIVLSRPLAPGTYNVTASLEGYEAATATVTVPADGGGVQHAFSLVRVGSAATAASGGAARGWGLPRRFGTFGGASADAKVPSSALEVPDRSARSWCPPPNNRLLSWHT